MTAKNGDFARNREIVFFIFGPFFAMFHATEIADFGPKRPILNSAMSNICTKSRILYRCPGG